MYAVYLQQPDEPDQRLADGFTRTAAAQRAWEALKTDAGPLATRPASFTALADAVANAFGGEACVTLVEEQ